MRSAAAMAAAFVGSPVAILVLVMFYSHILALSLAAGSRCPSRSISIALTEPYLEISPFDFAIAQFAAPMMGTRLRGG